MVYTYYEVGRLIVEEEQKGAKRAGYGREILKELSKRLKISFGKGFSMTNLEQMRFFYKAYSVPVLKASSRKSRKANFLPIPQTLSEEFLSLGNMQLKSNSVSSKVSQVPDFNLSWSHYLKLMRIPNPAERRFYEIESLANNWSFRELERQFDSSLYERLSLARDEEGIQKLSEKGQVIEKPQDLLKDPLVLEFIGLPEPANYSESDLEGKIIDTLKDFLLELGKGFLFAGRQVRFSFDAEHFKVDLVFYNRLLRCFVLIDLKIGKLTHQDLGQMQMYVNYYDRFVRTSDERKTIGIVLCKSKNEALVEITLPEDNEQIFASQYMTVLPSKEQLKQLLETK
jgi:predicted nuclease of restriction endonuclease-like (RecB) superfamily